MPKFAIVFIYSCCTFSTYSSFPQRPKRIPPTRPCSRPRYPQSRKFLLLCRHHPPSHCCFSHWYHWSSPTGTTGSGVTLCCCVVHLRSRRGFRSGAKRMKHWTAGATSPSPLLTFAVLFPTYSTKAPQTRRLTRPSAAAAPAADRLRFLHRATPQPSGSR